MHYIFYEDYSFNALKPILMYMCLQSQDATLYAQSNFQSCLHFIKNIQPPPGVAGSPPDGPGRHLRGPG